MKAGIKNLKYIICRGIHDHDLPTVKQPVKSNMFEAYQF